MLAEWYAVRKPNRPFASLRILEQTVAKAPRLQNAEQTFCLLRPADLHSGFQCFGYGQNRPIRKMLVGILFNKKAE